MKAKQQSNNNRRLFLLTFFSEDEEYTEREVNGWFLVKHWDGSAHQWTVGVYSKESLENQHKGRDKFMENQMTLI